jgi:hypothetical protein
MRPPPEVLQLAMQLAGVMLHDALSFTWHFTLHWISSTAAQVVAHSVVQLADGGFTLHW